MKAIAWHRYFLEQKELTGKTLFNVSELANVGQTTPQVLNLALARLVADGVAVRYARGWYGLPGMATIDQLMRSIDAGAYITSAAALHRYGMVTQVPVETVCFTNRRYNRSRQRRTPIGLLTFTCVQMPVYHPPQNDDQCAPAVQALYDFVYLSRREGADPQSLVSFRNLHKLDSAQIMRVGERYPESVCRQVRLIVENQRGRSVLSG